MHSWLGGVTLVLSLAMIVLALVTIMLKVKNRKIIVIKVLTTSCAVLIGVLNSSRFEWFIVLGLISGAIGDAFMEKPERFLQGMLAFLLGHILYCVGFGLKFTVPSVWVFLSVFVVLVILYLAILFKHLGNMKLPIFVYLVAIGTMFSFTFSALHEDISTLRVLLPIAGGLFVVSDFLIAVDRFVRRVPARDVLILGTYFISQLFISLSTIL